MFGIRIASPRESRATVADRLAERFDRTDLERVLDPSDRKFLAVAAAHAERPPVLQAMDVKWWGWRTALATLGVRIHFLCPEEIEAAHVAKYGQ